MSKSTQLGRGNALNRQSKEIIVNVHKFYQEQYAQNNSVIPVAKQVSEVTGVSLRTVNKVTLEHKKCSIQQTAMSSPKKKWKCSNKKIVIDEFDKTAIRRCIHDFHVHKKVLPTLSKLCEQLKTDINYKGSRSSLFRIMKPLGFRWRKMRGPRKLLIEKSDIVWKRIKYLRDMARYRVEGRPIVFTDETYVHSTHPSSMSLSESYRKGFRIPIAKGSRYIAVYAAGADGFIRNTLSVYESQKTGDGRHDNMNYKHYEMWLLSNLIPNLKPGSVVVIDDASYRNQVLNAAPKSNSSKQAMIEWLNENDIPFSTDMLKPELYQIILLQEPRLKQYKIDLLLREHGHVTLRLPPHHPELNPIDKVWGFIQSYGRATDVELTMANVYTLIESEVKKITDVQWSQICQNVEDEEGRLRDDDAIIDNITEQSLLVDDGDNSSDESDEDILSEDEGSLSSDSD